MGSEEELAKGRNEGKKVRLSFLVEERRTKSSREGNVDEPQ